MSGFKFWESYLTLFVLPGSKCPRPPASPDAMHLTLSMMFNGFAGRGTLHTGNLTNPLFIQGLARPGKLRLKHALKQSSVKLCKKTTMTPT